MQPPKRQVRATFDDRTITVYQAYAAPIAEPALEAGTFVAPFKRERMTWIKPSFFWMMYRAGWATKPGQERVLAVRITREGFESALLSSCLSHFDPDVHTDAESWAEQVASSPVRVQWDPERDERLQPLAWRSLQVGLSGVAVQRYVDEWIVDLTDVTDLAHKLRDREDGAVPPVERPYPLPDDVARIVGAG